MSWGAVIVGGAAVIGGGLSYMGAQKQSGAVSDAASRSSGAQIYMFDKQMALLQDAMDKGIIDINEAYDLAGQYIEPYTDPTAFNQALGYLKDPSKISDLPGYKFQFNEGQKTLENLASKTGGGLGGNLARAAVEYGQGFASTKLDEMLNRLLPFINISKEASTNLANLETSRGQLVADTRLRGAGAQSQAAQATGANLATTYNQAGENQANIAGGMYSSLSNVTNKAAENWAYLSTLNKTK